MQGSAGSNRARLVSLAVLMCVAVTAVPAWAATTAPKNSVTSKSIRNGQVKRKDIAANAVIGDLVANGSLTGADLAANSITGAQIDESTLERAGTAPSGPAGGDLGGTYPNPSIAALAVTMSKLADGAVSTAKLENSAVTLPKLAFDPATQAELDALATAGTINAAGNPVDWTRLKGVPPTFADGSDADSGGTVTLVDSGTGLLGGPITGSGSLMIAAGYRLPQGCSTGQVAKWNAPFWTCAADNDTTAPSGPAGGDLTGSYPSPAIAANTVTTAKIVDGTITGADVDESSLGTVPSATNADTLDSKHAAAFWQLSGNTATVPGTDFLGTTDNQALVFKVNGTRALRLEPAATSPNVIGGDSTNSATAGVHGATIGGGGDSVNSNLVTDDYGTVAGGAVNRAGNNTGATSDVPYATVAGGRANVASGSSSTVGGGANNTASAMTTVVAGGSSNSATALGGTVAGGLGNLATANLAFAGGGENNTASGSASTVAGGDGNSAGSAYSTVAGGQNNAAGVGWSAIGGGDNNSASGFRSTIAGGSVNSATDTLATVAGGGLNTASGPNSTVAGGQNNTAAGTNSFAAGYRAKALDNGSFVWGDRVGADFSSTAVNEFSVRATGGTRFVSGVDGTGAPTAGVELAPGAGAWSALSDRRLKEDVAPVSTTRILDRLAALPVTKWSYTAQGSQVRHIGPMAQDFADAFGVGEDRRHISTVDADGVALAAIQGLYKRLRAQHREIGALRERLEDQ